MRTTREKLGLTKGLKMQVNQAGIQAQTYDSSTNALMFLGQACVTEVRASYLNTIHDAIKM